MLKLIEFLIHGCWHRYEAKERISMYDGHKSEGKLPVGSKYVYQCSKCHRIKVIKDF